MTKHLLSAFTKAPVVLLGLFVALLIPFLSLPEITNADMNNTRADGFGTDELTGSSWLSGSGVEVYSNGSSSSVHSPATNNSVNGVTSGTEWQCVELINRLYLTKGWTASTWTGNGDTLINNVPTGLASQLNGSISYLNPGDVITFSDSTTGTSSDDGGHTAIINSTGSSIQIVSQNTVAVYLTATISSGSLAGGNAHLDISSSLPGYSVQAIIHHPAETNYLLTLSGGSLQGKAGLNDTWTSLMTGISEVKAAGTRIAAKDTSGNIWAKDTLSGTWQEVSYPVDAYAASSNLILTLSGGALQGKVGLTDQWTPLKTGVSSMKVAGTRIAVTDTSGEIWAKDGLNGNWYDETGPVYEYVVTPAYLITLSSTAFQGKAGLTDSWSSLKTYISDVKADGTRIAATDTSGNIWAKDTLSGTWYEETGAVTAYAVSSSYLLTLTGNNLQGKAGLNDTWTAIDTYHGVNMAVAGTRIAFQDNTFNHILAEDGLNTTQHDETTPVDQYVVTSTAFGEP